MSRWTILFIAVALFLRFATFSCADWPEFLNLVDSAATSDQPLPIKWTEQSGVLWKHATPGPGSSSPIVSKGRVFLTCYSGYGTEAASSDPSALKRHLICLDAKRGKQIWSVVVANKHAEDPYQGYITDHGYASNTPATDGERVYVNFGKAGVCCYDFSGKLIWQTDIGSSSSGPRWGSGASLTLTSNLVIVNAGEESRSIRAIDKLTGAEVWKYRSDALELCYGTPRVVQHNGIELVVVAALNEVWGLDASSGELVWFAKTDLTDNINPSPVVGDGVVYFFGGFRSSGCLAVRLGGEGDVTDTHVAWTSRASSYVATPVLFADHLYWIDYHGKAFCISAKTGTEVYRQRVAGFSMRRPVYASPIVAEDKLFIVTRQKGIYVVKTGGEFETVAINTFDADDSQFNATPAASEGKLYVRSDKFVYCIGQR